jgi:hypothetical protein
VRFDRKSMAHAIVHCKTNEWILRVLLHEEPVLVLENPRNPEAMGFISAIFFLLYVLATQRCHPASQKGL